MTEANKESWKRKGEKEDLRMEDLLAVCVLEEAAGFAIEETLEATALVDFLFPIMTDVGCNLCWPFERISRRRRGHARYLSFFPEVY